MASWDSTAFLAGLSDACGLCVATGALHLWAQLLLGGAVRCNEDLTDAKSSWILLLLRGVR